MNLKELTSPIRLYWDIGAGAGNVDYARIADDIAANKLLTLQITLSGKDQSGACGIILERLKAAPLACSLVVPLSAWNQELFAPIRTFPVRLLLLHASSVSELTSIMPVAAQTAGQQTFGIAFEVTRENFRGLPEVVRFCIDQQVKNLVLPMQRLTGTEEVFFLSIQERRELETELNRIQRPAWLKITIHDPFLWRAFFPSIDFPDGGCQAANTMLYISPEACVYPCPTMPVSIGDLRTMSLHDVIRSEQKKEIRRKILLAHSDCAACPEVKQCKGGCRGRVYAIHKNFEKSDPACR